MNRLKIGNNIYDDSFLLSGNLTQDKSLVGDELPYDTSRFKLLVKRPSQYLLDSKLRQLVTINGQIILDNDSVPNPEFNVGDPVTWEYDDKLLMRHYVTEATRIGQYQYQVDCASGVGKLADQTHFGGLYAAKKYADVIAEIIGGAIPYKIDPAIGNISVYGWLPVGSKRDNLLQLLFATNTRLMQDENGGVVVTYYSSETPQTIPENKIAQGARLSFSTAISSVAITEHQYVKTANDVCATLFDGEVPSQEIVTPNGVVTYGMVVTFDAPHYNLAVSGGAITESGVNYAVLAPSSNAVLTGFPYSHITSTIVRPQGALRDTSTVEVPSATLVNSLNSEGIAQKVLSYYQSSESAEMDVWDSSAVTGSPVVFTDAYGQSVEGRVESKQSVMSANLKSTFKVVSNFTPSSPGNVYHSAVMLVGDNNVAIKNGTIIANGAVIGNVGNSIRLVLVGGGSGGDGGDGGLEGGTPTKSDTQWQYTNHGYGGSGGKGGNGGKILIKKIDFESDLGFSIHCGSGGIGGVAGEYGGGKGGKGANGAATTCQLTTSEFLSSDSGEPSVNGYRDMFLGVTVGIPGTDGFKGGNGGFYSDTPSLTPLYASSAESVNGFKGGADGSGFNASGSWDGQWLSSQAFGGLGGGASNIANGRDGFNGGAQGNKTGSYFTATGGTGNDGADAGAGASASYYGCGGGGGSGGGGGGDAGTAWVDNTGKKKVPWTEGAPGAGGNGGAGGAGYEGCAIIIF